MIGAISHVRLWAGKRNRLACDQVHLPKYRKSKKLAESPGLLTRVLPTTWTYNYRIFLHAWGHRLAIRMKVVA